MIRSSMTLRAAAAVLLRPCSHCRPVARPTTRRRRRRRQRRRRRATCDVTLASSARRPARLPASESRSSNGAQLAIDQYNEDADCEVGYELIDSQGSPDQAPSLATEAAGNDAIIGIVGPAFSGESAAAGPIFAEAGLPTITPSATNPTLADNGWDTFHRALGNDATQGPAAASYIQDTIGAKKVFVIDDASEYGAGLAGIVKDALGDTVVDTDTIQAGQTDFSAIGDQGQRLRGRHGVLRRLLRRGRSDHQPAPRRRLRRHLRRGRRCQGPGFLEGAQGRRRGHRHHLPLHPGHGPSVADFAAAYEEAFGEAPGTYAAEAYDAATIFLQGIADGNGTREDMLAWVNELRRARHHQAAQVRRQG